ncbi:MAG: S-methyl-5'-thioadenosine phosphorylase, partial [Bradymonadia bacterium]
PPSDVVVCGTINGTRCAFLPRHGKGHVLTPSEVNYRANVWALKSLGVKAILSVSAVGSLREKIEPGHLVCPDQFIDRTRGRASTFFGDGVVGHVQFGEPIEEAFRQIVLSVARQGEAVVHDGGCYVCIEGPTFSTKAESNLFRSWGGDIVGMTNLPEARLAREAEIGYATLGLSTDYDCWRDGHDEVSVEAVIAIIQQNVKVAQNIIRGVCESLSDMGTFDWPAHHALGNGSAIITDRSLISEEARTRLQVVMGQYL